MILPKPSSIRFEDVPVPGTSSFALREFRWPRFPLNWHYHPEVELTLISKGHGLRFVGDSIQDFRPGDLCLLGANIPHCWTSPAEARGGVCSLVLQFRAETWGRDFWHLPEIHKIDDLLSRSRRGFVVQGETRRSIASRLEGLASCPVGTWRRLHMLLEILGELSDSADLESLTSVTYQTTSDHASNRKLARVLQYVQDHLTQDLSQHEAAASLGVSPAAFSQFFRRNMGRTFVDFVNDLRIRHASRALLESSVSITQIAFDSGFNNLSHFHAQFRRLRGTTPRAYRESAAQMGMEKEHDQPDLPGRFR